MSIRDGRSPPWKNLREKSSLSGLPSGSEKSSLSGSLVRSLLALLCKALLCSGVPSGVALWLILERFFEKKFFALQGCLGGAYPLPLPAEKFLLCSFGLACSVPLDWTGSALLCSALSSALFVHWLGSESRGIRGCLP